MSPVEWRNRHRFIWWLIALHAAGLFGYGLARGIPPLHAAEHVTPLVLSLLGAGYPRLGRRLRSAVATLGLVGSTAVVIHVADGMPEAHLHFFVTLLVIMFYQDWLAYLVAAAVVVVEHIVIDPIAPHAIYTHPDGTQPPHAWAALHLMFLGAASAAVLVHWRVTERAQDARDRAVAELEYRTSHDALTGTLNRAEFERRVATALVATGRDREPYAVCAANLDRFRIVTETCGQAAGDELLRQVAAALRELDPHADLARLGGDRFAVLLPGHTLADAVAYAERLRCRLAQRGFGNADRAFEVTASIGVVPVTSLALAPQEVIGAAEAACYAAKDKGRNRVEVYEPDDAALARHRNAVEWAARVMAALREDRLELYFQPIVPVSGHAHGRFGELLLRLRDTDGTMVAPGAFLPAAERYDLLPALDRWVVGATFAALARHYAGRPADGDRYSINLSGPSVGDPRFLEYIRAQLAETGVRPDLVCFEITETVAITDLTAAADFISTLRGLGFHFALDDFGAGLSSFAYLKCLPVDYLKIDGNFVRGITRDPVDRLMVESVNGIGHRLGLRTIAEFVEDDEILGCVRAAGVDFAQGYGIARPGPFQRWLERSVWPCPTTANAAG
ncbi:putative bifunctional diguanylate cyclase/phosphodiesterase [Micromonospora pattaloongensis]|uniref:putative bifunctional diguanylate cyclase/phosphodiesterase n=1 Tax=Micromonospora pattaloongensis TaxID=405436 RepID=UPI001587C632|nr:EAL domain-containing protein [Micromonospora pattaloongensis]